MSRILPFLIVSLALATGSLAATPAGEVGPGVPAFKVRPGYKVTLVADHLGEARFITFGEGDTLYLSQPLNGKILCLRDLDADGKYKTITTFISHRPTVHGMQWYKGWLWFTQTGSIHKVQPNPDGTAGPIHDINTGPLPQRGAHWWRSILVDDGGFYTSIGDDGNANDHYQLTDDIASQREKIWHFNLDGSNKKLFCTGIRNTEKLLHRPGTAEVWGCDHGSDHFGASLGEHRNGNQQPVTDHCPPDELNHYVQDGFYGHPFITGYGVPRYEFLKRKDILELAADNILPAWCNGPHWANDGWTFLQQSKLTGQAGDAVIAFHGSWNSEKKVGYCIQRIEFDPITGQPCGSITLVSTLAANGSRALARPVDCAEAPDGSLLFTSDSTQQIFRLTRIAPVQP